MHPWLRHRGRLSQKGKIAPEDDDALRLLRSQYFALCEETDAQLGRLFDSLRERGEYERTLVVFTVSAHEPLSKSKNRSLSPWVYPMRPWQTDHGEQLGDRECARGFFLCRAMARLKRLHCPQIGS